MVVVGRMLGMLLQMIMVEFLWELDRYECGLRDERNITPCC
jgi:hypothetical protein